MELTGKELHQMLIACGQNDGYGFPRVGGIKCEVTYDKGDPQHIKDLKVFTPDGKKLNMKKTYRVVTSSYVTSICDSPRKDQGHSINKQTADMIISYLEKQPSVSYQGMKRVNRIVK